MLNWIIATAIVLGILLSIFAFKAIALMIIAIVAAIALVRWLLEIRKQSPAGWRGILY